MDEKNFFQFLREAREMREPNRGYFRENFRAGQHRLQRKTLKKCKTLARQSTKFELHSGILGGMLQKGVVELVDLKK